MPRGGRREGSGRKPGQATLKTREAADIAATEGVTPVPVMLRLMRHFFGLAFAVDENGKEVVDEEMASKAGAWAIAAAPYCHPRLQATTVEPPQPPAPMDEAGAVERARRAAFMLIDAARKQSKKLLPEKS